LKCSSAHPISLAIKEELDKREPPKGYLRVERVVSVSSCVLVTEHRIIKRKGREEVDLAFEKYWFGAEVALDFKNPAFDWIHEFDNGRPVAPTSVEIVQDKEH
jgi:hypothetical protein